MMASDMEKLDNVMLSLCARNFAGPGLVWQSFVITEWMTYLTEIQPVVNAATTVTQRPHTCRLV